LTVAWWLKLHFVGLLTALQQYTNERLAFATEPMLEIQEIAPQIDSAYTSMRLPARTNILELGRLAVFEDASLEPASVMAELIAIKQNLSTISAVFDAWRTYSQRRIKSSSKLKSILGARF